MADCAAREGAGLMVFLLRALPGLIELGLLIYGLIDCIQTPDGAVRNLP